MRPFTYTALPGRVVFGFGTISQVATEIEALGCCRAMVLTTPPQKETAALFAERLGRLSAGSFTEAAMHTPIDVTERAVMAAREAGADCVVAARMLKA